MRKWDVRVLGATVLLIGAGWLLWLRSNAEHVQPPLDETVDFETWAAACLSLPANRGAISVPKRTRLPLKDVGPLYRLVDRLLDQQQSLQPWLEKESVAETGFRPFAQKLALEPGSRVVVHGDLHGDIRSLIVSLQELQRREILDGFRLTVDDVHLVFLGDYTDRGFYGVEVLYTLMRLKLENPDQVWLTRGNHEQLSMVERYGFEHEGLRKYGGSFDVKRVVKIFDGLPSVIYVGAKGNYMQSCHGGMEPGYDPRRLLQDGREIVYEHLGMLKRAAFRAANRALFRLLVDPTNESVFDREFVDFVPVGDIRERDLGFMWHEFTLFQEDQPLADEAAGELTRYGQDLTTGILEAHSTPKATVRGVLRAHQHSRVLDPMMRRLLASNGVFRHWQKREMPSDDGGRNARVRAHETSGGRWRLHLQCVPG